MTTAAPLATTAATERRFPLPRWFDEQLEDAAARGARAAALASPSLTGDRRSFARWAVDGFPPVDTSGTARELEFMHDVAARRTPARNSMANWYAVRANDQRWQHYLQEWQSTVGPTQAAWGEHLLDSAFKLEKAISHRAKKQFDRPRPYVQDPTLTTAVPLPSSSSASYPSGHTSTAFAAATVLGGLMPDRAAEFRDVAKQMAMARVYGGVHFPSDTVAGAYNGAMVGSWLLRTTPRPDA